MLKNDKHDRMHNATQAVVRDAEPRDLGAVAEIWNPLIRDSFVTFHDREKDVATLEALRGACVAAGHAFLVLDLPGAGIAGFATFRQFRAGPGYARSFEHTIVLAATARGAGHGRRIMATLEDRARQAGGHTLWAGVSGANPGGRAFHASLGFAEIARLPEVGFKAGRWLDLVLMCKRL